MDGRSGKSKIFGVIAPLVRFAAMKTYVFVRYTIHTTHGWVTFPSPTFTTIGMNI